MTTGSVGGKNEAKECITNALLGLLLAISSWLILNTINPLLLINKPVAGVVAAPLAPATPTVNTPQGTLSWQNGPSCPTVTGTITGVVSPTFCGGTAPTGTSICCQYVPVNLPPPVATPPPPPLPVGLPPYVPSPVSGPVWVDRSGLSVSEAAGSIKVVIQRAGNIAGTVDYALIAGTATAGLDFGTISGTLNFPVGVNSLTVTIPILEDALVETNETFTFVLKNPTGGITLGTPTTQIITINDNDALPADVNPPVVVITSPANTVGSVTSASSISTVFNVTEDVSLARVDLFTVRQSTHVQMYTKGVCGSAPLATCLKLGGNFTQAITIGPNLNEYYDIVARACDTAGNCGYATTTIGFTADCTPKTGATTRICFTVPSGASSVLQSTAGAQTSAGLIKLTSASGGGSVNVTTVAPYNGWYGAYCSDMWGNGNSWCGFGCDASGYGCNLTQVVPVCGGISCSYGCAYDQWTPICNTTPPVPMCGGVSCPSGCAVSPDVAECFVPPPVVIASLSATPGDIAQKSPCGNGGTYPGFSSYTIYFSTTGGCVLKPYFNYFLNISASDNAAHNFTLNYNWLPSAGPVALDTTAPLAPTVSTPVAGGTVTSSTVGISGTASEPGTIYVYQNTITGTLLGTASTNGGTNAWSLSRGGIADGTYTIVAVEHDLAGNVGPATTVTFTVNNVPPAPTVTAPINGFIALSTSTPITISGTGSTASDVIRIYLDNIFAGSTSVLSGLTWTYSTAMPATGAHTILTTETNSAGKISASSTQVSFTAP